MLVTHWDLENPIEWLFNYLYQMDRLQKQRLRKTLFLIANNLKFWKMAEQSPLYQMDIWTTWLFWGRFVWVWVSLTWHLKRIPVESASEIGPLVCKVSVMINCYFKATTKTDWTVLITIINSINVNLVHLFIKIFMTHFLC